MIKPIIDINNLTIEYPVYGIRNLSLKTKIFQDVIGGSLFKNTNN